MRFFARLIGLDFWTGSSRAAVTPKQNEHRWLCDFLPRPNFFAAGFHTDHGIDPKGLSLRNATHIKNSFRQ